MKKPTIIFVPHYKATKKHLVKHIEFVRGLGFESLVFEPRIYGRPFLDVIKSILTRGKNPNFINRWGGDLDSFLHKNDLKNKKVIFYTFSAPSFMVLDHMNRFPDTKLCAWICEGGPFSHFRKCLFNYMTYGERIKFLPKRFFLIFTDYFLWAGPLIQEKTFQELKKFPSSIPILSFRGLKDKMTPHEAIEALFSPHKHLNLKALTLDCEHLKGIKQAEKIYKKEVEDFLKQACAS